MKLAQFYIFCAIISIGAGNKELEDKLNRYKNPDDKEVLFHVAIEIPARKIECFYQQVGKGAKLEVGSMVLKGAAGADQKVVMKMWDPNGEEMEARPVTSDQAEEVNVENTGNTTGTYKICFYNLDKFFTRLVDVSVLVTNLNWAEHLDALPEPILEDLDKAHMTESLSRLHTLFRVVSLQVQVIKRRMFADFLTVQSNLTYVDRLGLMSCIAIIGSGMLQVYFVRRMFETPNVRSTAVKT